MIAANGVLGLLPPGFVLKLNEGVRAVAFCFPGGFAGELVRLSPHLFLSAGVFVALGVVNNSDWLLLDIFATA